MQQITLSDMLANEVKTNGLDEKLARLIETVAACGVEISSEVACGALMGVLGMAGSENVQGEEQKKLDVISNDIVTKAVLESGVVAACASEEMDHCVAADCTDRRPYLICYDPLDGSSNIDINVSIGTIFSILPNPHEDATAPQDADILQPGDRQLAAGYIMYGPQTQMALTLGRGVVMFTLDPRTNTYILTNDNVQVPEQAKEFAINCSNKRHWEAPVNRYIEELLAGKTGVRGKDYNMRWVAAMVAEVHRILCRGGIFMYPKDNRDPSKPGKLRLMYEANPMSWLMEQAGGRATNGYERILSIKPEKLHQRVAVFLGAKEEVERVTSYHAA